MESAELIGIAVVGIYALYALIMMAFGLGPTTASTRTVPPLALRSRRVRLSARG